MKVTGFGCLNLFSVNDIDEITESKKGRTKKKGRALGRGRGKEGRRRKEWRENDCYKYATCSALRNKHTTPFFVENFQQHDDGRKEAQNSLSSWFLSKW